MAIGIGVKTGVTLDYKTLNLSDVKFEFSIEPQTDDYGTIWHSILLKVNGKCPVDELGVMNSNLITSERSIKTMNEAVAECADYMEGFIYMFESDLFKELAFWLGVLEKDVEGKIFEVMKNTNNLKEPKEFVKLWNNLSDKNTQNFATFIFENKEKWFTGNDIDWVYICEKYKISTWDLEDIEIVDDMSDVDVIEYVNGNYDVEKTAGSYEVYEMLVDNDVKFDEFKNSSFEWVYLNYSSKKEAIVEIAKECRKSIKEYLKESKT